MKVSTAIPILDTQIDFYESASHDKMRLNKRANINHQSHIAKCTETNPVNYKTEHKDYGRKHYTRMIVKVLIKKNKPTFTIGN